MITAKSIISQTYPNTRTKNIFKSSNGGLKENTNTEEIKMIDSATDLYQKYMSFNSIMLEEHKALEIAAVMVIQGLTFYRTCMSEEDYQRITKSIYEKRDEVKTFG